MQTTDLKVRTKKFSIRIIKLVEALPANKISDVLVGKFFDPGLPLLQIIVQHKGLT